MSKSRRMFGRAFKIQVVHELEAGVPMAELARRHEVHPNQIHRWVQQYRKHGEDAFRHGGSNGIQTNDARIAELEQTIGQLTMENRFLKKLLQRLETASQNGQDGPR